MRALNNEQTHLELRDVPILDLVVRRVARERDIEALDCAQTV